jgi:tRNA threonylcarbamoyladenosine biosynthesis protein TsaB
VADVNDTGDRQVTGVLLAIDTTSSQAGIALFDGEQLHETSWLAGQSQTVTVLDQIDCLLCRSEMTIGDVRAVAVATGPGMFNALRVGMSLAKGLVIGLDVPLIGVPSLDAAALPFVGGPGPVIAVIAAGRQRLVWAEFRSALGMPERATEPRNGTIDELVEHVRSITPFSIVTGELSPGQRQQLSAVPNVVVPTLSGRLRRAGALAELAWHRWTRGEVDDAIELEPTYLHAASR